MIYAVLGRRQRRLVLPALKHYTRNTMAESQQEEPSSLISLPLFPLNLVLFPGMALPLHIFEERYKDMIGDCIDRKDPFGIVLIKEGLEVGEPAVPFQIGTTANITNVERLAEGRLNILAKGQQRFETVEVVQRSPHIVGQIRYLEEQPGEVSVELAAEAASGYSDFIRNLSALAGGWTAHAEVPKDPIGLSFGIASNLDLPTSTRQELLEFPTAQQRLEMLLPLLKQRNEALQKEVVKRNPFQGPRLN